VSEGGFEDGADDGFWNIFLMSILGLAAAAEATEVGAVDDDAEVDAADDEGVGDKTDVLDEIDALPLTWPEVVAGTDPKDFTLPSDLTGGAEAGDEDIGAEASSIDPKVTPGACFIAPTLLRGTLTPSFTGTP